MAGFTKLFSSIVDSTIWREDPYTKVVWVTMLAKADKNGLVNMSLPGLADAARVTIEQCKNALTIFLGPDEYSRTKDFEGRRILEVEGGWVLLNYIKYRKIQDEDEIRILTAERVRRYRAKYAGCETVTDVTLGNDEKRNVQEVTQFNAIAEAEAEAEKRSTPLPPKGGRSKRAASWNHSFPKDVVEAVNNILDFWPDPKKDIQPKKCAADPTQYVPETHSRFLAARLADIQQEGGDLKICVEIAKQYVDSYRRGRNWVKAAEYFFGKTEDAKWKAYYQSEITNREIEAHEPDPA